MLVTMNPCLEIRTDGFRSDGCKSCTTTNPWHGNNNNSNDSPSNLGRDKRITNANISFTKRDKETLLCSIFFSYDRQRMFLATMDGCLCFETISLMWSITKFTQCLLLWCIIVVLYQIYSFLALPDSLCKFSPKVFSQTSFFALQKATCSRLWLILWIGYHRILGRFGVQVLYFWWQDRLVRFKTVEGCVSKRKQIPVDRIDWFYSFWLDKMHKSLGWNIPCFCFQPLIWPSGLPPRVWPCWRDRLPCLQQSPLRSTCQRYLRGIHSIQSWQTKKI